MVRTFCEECFKTNTPARQNLPGYRCKQDRKVIEVKKILLIEDDIDLREELACLLRRNGYETMEVVEFANVEEQMEHADADLILLDITLPGMDGQELLKKFRKKSLVPVIMVTSKNTEMDEVLCMTYGADDFVAKPYNPMILLLHIEAIFRRMSDRQERILTYGALKLDVGRSCLEANGKTVELTKNEKKILSYLLQHQGSIVSRDELMSDLWESEEFVDDNTLTVNITRIRKKLEECGQKDIIRTKRGEGYIIG